MHQHAIQLCSGPLACYKDDGSRDLISPIVQRLVHNLYNNLILLSRSYKESIKQAQLLLDTLHNLGFGIHPGKCIALPSQSARNFGHTGEQQKDAVPSASDKVRSTRREIRWAFSKNKISTLAVRKFCSLLGKLNSLSGAVLSAPLQLWLLHHLM